MNSTSILCALLLTIVVGCVRNDDSGTKRDSSETNGADTGIPIMQRRPYRQVRPPIPRPPLHDPWPHSITLTRSDSLFAEERHNHDTSDHLPYCSPSRSLVPIPERLDSSFETIWSATVDVPASERSMFGRHPVEYHLTIGLRLFDTGGAGFVWIAWNTENGLEWDAMPIQRLDRKGDSIRIITRGLYKILFHHYRGDPPRAHRWERDTTADSTVIIGMVRPIKGSDVVDPRRFDRKRRKGVGEMALFARIHSSYVELSGRIFPIYEGEEFIFRGTDCRWPGPFRPTWRLPY